MDKNDRMDKNVFVYQNSTAIATFMKFEISYENQVKGARAYLGAMTHFAETFFRVRSRSNSDVTT